MSPLSFIPRSGLWSTESYYHQVLSDEKKRALYDQYGEAGVKSAVGGSAGAYTVLPFNSSLL
jgi:DnaJ-class molecular chaperone